MSEPVRLNGLPVSSSRIRAALQAGDIRQANACLGRPFRVTGRILSTWRDRARDELVVTLASDRDHANPCTGAYACRAQIDGTAASHQAVVEIGACSCFDMGKHTLLVHLRDFDGEVYGHSMTLDLIEGERLDAKNNVSLPVTYRPLGTGVRSAPAATMIDEG